MKYRSALLFLTLFATSAFAGVGTLPGHSTDAPGSNTVGAPMTSDSNKEAMWTDANGDGLVQKAEVKPGTQLAKRFDTRDANHDGVLSPDEYYVAR